MLFPGTLQLFNKIDFYLGTIFFWLLVLFILSFGIQGYYYNKVV